MDELTIGGKVYVSSKRAAEITGYAKDYVGQLCREGHVEARMVGRSWYVLESSIREHRFGKEADEPSGKAEPKSGATSSTWEPPTYESESAPIIPALTERVSVNVFEMEREVIPAAPSAADGSAALSDMQAAWREWFNDRPVVAPEGAEEPVVGQNEPEYAVDDQDVSEEEHDEVPITLNRLEEVAREPEEDAYEEPVVIHRSYSSMPLDLGEEEREGQQHENAPTPDRLVQRPLSATRVPSRAPSSLPVKAALVALAGLAVAVAVIGTGHAESYINSGISSPILDYLQGQTTFQRK